MSKGKKEKAGYHGIYLDPSTEETEPGGGRVLSHLAPREIPTFWDLIPGPPICLTHWSSGLFPGYCHRSGLRAA